MGWGDIYKKNTHSYIIFCKFIQTLGGVMKDIKSVVQSWAKFELLLTILSLFALSYTLVASYGLVNYETGWIVTAYVIGILRTYYIWRVAFNGFKLLG